MSSGMSNLPSVRKLTPPSDPPCQGAIGEQFVKRVAMGNVTAFTAATAGGVGAAVNITPADLVDIGLLDLDYLYVEKVEAWSYVADRLQLTALPAVGNSFTDPVTFVDYGSITESARCGFAVPAEIALQVRTTTPIATVQLGANKFGASVATSVTVPVRMTVWCRV